MSSEDEVIFKRKKKITVAESSDESEVVVKNNANLEDNESDNEELISPSTVKVNILKKQRRITTLDSSSDSEDDSNIKLEKKTKSPLKHIPKYGTTDSEEDIGSVKNNKNSSDEDDESSKQANETKESVKHSISKNLWYNNSDIYDAEGSSEEEEKEREQCKSTSDHEDHNSLNEEVFSTKSSKQKQRKKPSKRTERKSKMKAQDDIKTEIRKESQRLAREAPLSLPYHRPKQRTLAEFLVRRKSTPKVSLQASSEELVTVLKIIEQREKEAELFYKSESSEDDTVMKEGEAKIEKNSGNDIFIEETKVLHNEEQSLQSDIVINEASQRSSTINDEDSNKSENNCTAKNETALTGKNTEKCSVDKDNTQEVDLNTAELKISNDELHETNIFNNSETKDKILGKLVTAEESDDLQHNSLEDDEKLSENCKQNIAELMLEPSQNILNNNVLSDISVSNDKINCPCNLINTEEFSLKLSESQSEYESTENQSFQNPLCSTNKDIDENTTDGNNSSVTDKVDCENQSNKTIDEYKQKGQLETSLEDIRKQEISVENELYKKYNIKIENLATSKPKIIGSHEEIIDLNEGTPKPEVNQLMKRFLTHLSYKKKPKKKAAVELSVVSTVKDSEGHVSGISEESVRVLVGEGEEEEDPSLARPGAKLARLRAQLQQQMEQQREQEWTKKLEQQRLYEDEDVFEGEKDVCDGLEDESEKVEDSDNDKEKDETEEEEEEEEPSEDEDDESDEEVAEKRRKSRSIFLDDEAEESDEEPFTAKVPKYRPKKNNSNDDDEPDDCVNLIEEINCNNEKDDVGKTEGMDNKRSGREENVKGSHGISDFFIKRPAKMKPVLPRRRTASDIFSSQEIKGSTDEEELPSFQMPRSMDEKENDVEEKLSETPSITSPAFQLTALENMDVTNKYNWSAPSTPCKEFLSSKTNTPVRAIATLVEKSPQVCTQDLENMCSGNFISQNLPEADENTQDFELFLNEDSQLSKDQGTPLKSSSKSGKAFLDLKDPVENEVEDEPAGKKHVKKAKKLNFSDDEDDGDERQDAEEDVERSDEEGSDDDGNVNAEVEYDSEENEVEVKTAGGFLDVEAELSEEEWSSEDEDERGLDALEMEEADKEHIDQRRLRRELGQIHMKELLKEDKMQVKLLQEMLLEDGELHSEGKRQRLFRWSNNAAFNEGDSKAVLDSDEEKGEEDEDEELWRKSRHERELFLQEQKKKTEKLEVLELEDSDSQLLKLGQKALKRLNSNSQEPKLTPPTLTNPLASPDAKKPFVLPKRGSFLSRGQQTLSRLAQMVSSVSDGPIQQAKNSRNFVFTSISPTKDEKQETKQALVPNKRKLPHLPLPIAKKPCVQKPKTANKKSLFEALTRVNS